MIVAARGPLKVLVLVGLTFFHDPGSCSVFLLLNVFWYKFDKPVPFFTRTFYNNDYISCGIILRRVILQVAHVAGGARIQAVHK